MRSLSGASLACVAVLALGSFTAAGCAKVGEIQAKKAFKAANAAYQQQDYKKASDLYEQTIQADPNLNSAYFFLGNSYDNLYKPSKKGDPANDALMTKAVENYQKASEKLSTSPNPEKKKLGDNPEFKRRLAFLRNKLLMGFELQEETKAAITDDALRQTYNDALKSAGGQEEVHARHILVENEDEAKTILDQLKGGADFATLAKEKSKDPGAAEGGDLGFFTKDQMVPEFADVAFKMYPGQLSNPVKTQFGWHIIKVEDKRTKQPPEFEKVKDQIEAFLARKAQTDFITKLRQTAKVERLDKPADQKPAEQK